jgi:hypothetical protein
MNDDLLAQRILAVLDDEDALDHLYDATVQEGDLTDSLRFQELVIALRQRQGERQNA